MPNAALIRLKARFARIAALGEAAGMLHWDAAAMMRDAVREAPVEERTDVGLLRERVRSELQRVLRRKAGRRPLIVPVVMEI